MYIKKLSHDHLLNLLFCLFPISFIIGNLIVTLNLYIFLIVGFSYITKKKYKLCYDYTNIILISFFLFIVFTSFINFFEKEFIESENTFFHQIKHGYLFKSILLLRFVILYLVVEALLINNKLNLKKFFIVSFVCTSFASFDLIIQYIFEYDLFGYKINPGGITGVFGDEAIAGSYIQKFSLISIFGLLFFLEKNKKKTIIFLIILLLLIGTFLATNRMNMILLIFSLVLLGLFTKKIRFLIFYALLGFFIATTILIKYDEKLRINYQHLYSRFIMPSSLLFSDNKNKENYESADEVVQKNKNYNKIDLNKSVHFRIFKTAILSWKNSPLIGWGHKSFPINCKDIIKNEAISKSGMVPVCSSHPHNYTIEVLHNTGLFGFILISSFVFVFFLKILKKIMRKKLNKNYLVYFFPIMLTTFIEIWPIKTAGSLFGTWNGTAVWLFISLSVVFKNKFENKKFSEAIENKNSLILKILLTLIIMIVVKRILH